MSIVAYYARVDEHEFEALQSNAERFWEIAEMPWDLAVPSEPGVCERLYIDKDWQVLCWLCSAVGRAEERHQAGLARLDNFDLEGDAFQRAIAEKVEAMGYAYINPNSSTG
ncbi:DUF1877 family protein [Hyphomonas sp.]|uniref:DUF1877 family protein n=1 Tax=Hyphomonas sp. TaxID=87 RepID=UPI00391B1CDC